jgi:hypothetical protein
MTRERVAFLPKAYLNGNKTLALAFKKEWLPKMSWHQNK